MAERVVIVGAGIIGAVIAYHLAGHQREVIVLDAGLPGQQASGRSFGWINASFHLDEDHYHFRAKAMEAWRDLASSEPSLTVNWCGCLCWEFTGQAQNDQFANLNALGYPVEMLGRDALGEYGAGLENLPETALWFPTEGFVEADSATRALLRAAAAKGAQVVSGVSVQALTEKGGRITGVKTQVQDMLADQVILAAGVGAPMLLATLGLDLPMLSRPGLLVHSEPLPMRINGIIVSEGGQEFRQDASGRIVAPASVSHQSDSAEAISGDPRELAEAALARVSRYLSGGYLKVEHIAHAMRPVPGDGHPCIGPMGPDGLYVAVLHSGVTLAPLVGATVAEEITSAVKAPELSRYRPNRF